MMLTGHVRVMQQTDPRKVRLLYERSTHWSEVFENNPRIAQIGERGDFQEYQPRVNGLRPYCAEKSQARWRWREYKPHPGELFFSGREKYLAEQHAPVDVILEPSVKRSASPNKDWGLENWQTLANLLVENRYTVAQVGPKGTKILNAGRLVETSSFRLAAAYLARAKAAVLPEGGLHHAAAAVGVRSVVIYGGYISPKQTGYDMHTNIFTGGEPCGWRTKCKHCADAMAKITPEQVFEELKKLL